MNAGDYGILFEFGTSFNMASQTLLQLAFTKPNGTLLTVSATLGTVDTGSPPNIFLANQYLKYTTVNGDIDQAGTYTVRAIYGDAAPTHLISDPVTFDVGTGI